MFLCGRQYPVGAYALDFYGPEAMICIGVDWEQQLARTLEDRLRDEFLLEKGIVTMRIPSLELFEPTGIKFARWEILIRETCEQRVAAKASE